MLVASNSTLNLPADMPLPSTARFPYQIPGVTFRVKPIRNITQSLEINEVSDLDEEPIFETSNSTLNLPANRPLPSIARVPYQIPEVTFRIKQIRNITQSLEINKVSDLDEGPVLKDLPSS